MSTSSPSDSTAPADTASPAAAVGDLVGPVQVESVAHGGHAVARLPQGETRRVIFVRHALPGELVRVRLTDVSQARFWRGEAVEVLEPSDDRVTPRCPIAGPGGCGGCDLQHVSAAGQGRWKQAVVAEQLERLAGITWHGHMESPEPRWGWRRRTRYWATEPAQPGGPGLGMRRHRSHDVVPLPTSGCAIAAPEIAGTDIELPGWPDGSPRSIDLVRAASGTEVMVDESDVVVTEEALGRRFEVDAQGFWQAHPAAVEVLSAAVLAGLEPNPGDRGFDLYCGVGVFAAALADAGVQMWGVEGNRAAVEHAKRNVAGVRFTAGSMEKMLARLPKSTDLVVLDPPRTGAGKNVISQIASRRPRRIAYVACDPAALARDLRHAEAMGYAPTSIRAFDLFPQTHHIECVAILAR